jgi:N-hydroxyarylamine O-acetyltransferase
MPPFDPDAYLDRIGWWKPALPSFETLSALQRCHLRAVPFENLDVYARLAVDVGLDWSYPKIVNQRRGGWCFELNGCFAELLRLLGYDVTLLSARVFGNDGPGPEMDHLTLLVRLDGRRWLVDVGFGDSALVPLCIDDDSVQDGGVRRSRIDTTESGFTLLDETTTDTYAPQFTATFSPRQRDDFAARSLELRTTPGLPWTTRRFATRATDDRGGRVWLLTDRLKVRDDTGTTESPVAEDDWSGLLQEHFGMTLPTEDYL